jgi:hypothetical protein
MLRASLEHSRGRAKSLTLTNGFLILGVLLVVRETRFVPTISFTFGAGVSDGEKGARRPSHTISTCLVTTVCGVSSACFVTRFTYVLLRHGTGYIHDHVKVPFDIVIV